MNRALLPAALVAWLLLQAVASGACAVTPGGALPGEPAGGVREGGNFPFLFPNVSMTSRAPGAHDWYEQGFALTNEERYAEAIIAYERAVAANRSLLNAWYYLGDALFHEGRYEEALLAFRNATAIDPDFVDAYFYEGAVYRESGLWIEEEAALGRGLAAAERIQEKGGTGTGAGGEPFTLPSPPGTAIAGLAITAAIWTVLHQGKR